MFTESVLRKHVVIIHAYSMMSVLQRKIVNVLLHQMVIKSEQITQDNSMAIECDMAFSDLITAINFNSHNTTYLKESIDKLASLKIEWNLLRDRVPSNVSFLNLRVLHGAPTFFQDGTFNFSFHKFMLDFVGSPDIYGTIDIGLQADFESRYGHALYENSTRFVNMQKGKIIQLGTLRKLLGVADGKYQNMRELTRNVIKPAVEEVNDRAAFVVSLQPLKAAQKIMGFEIIVDRKQGLKQIDGCVAVQRQQPLIDEITQTFGQISNSVLENILKNYSQEYIQQKILYTKHSTKRNQFGFYPIPYFISALKNDYRRSEQLTEENKALHQDNKDRQLWHEKLNVLHADLANWQRNLQAIGQAGDPSKIDTVTNIIEQCEESLRAHMLEKPAELGQD